MLWETFAACRRLEPETADRLFFGSRTDDQAVALSLCRSCPARTACLAAAMAEETAGYGRYGIRGGLRAADRRALAHRTAQAS